MGGCRRKFPTGRLGAVLCLAASTLLASGCQLIGGSDPLPPTLGTVQGMVYQGFLILDGGEIPAGLEIIRNGGREVQGALQTTSGLTADGPGRLKGKTLTLNLSYGGTCPGTISMEGEWDEEGGTFRGTAAALDCTGKASGTFRFSGR